MTALNFFYQRTGRTGLDVLYSSTVAGDFMLKPYHICIIKQNKSTERPRYFEDSNCVAAKLIFKLSKTKFLLDDLDLYLKY